MTEPVITTNTPRAGETAEQTAARTAPRGNSAYPAAKLLFLTDPEPGKVFWLNVQIEEGELMRFSISREQLLVLNGDTADILKRAFR